jgi:hypothetical protein
MSWAHWPFNNCLGTLASQYCNNKLFKMGVQNPGCYIKSFNLRFTKLYNQIPELIPRKIKPAFMHYYNALPSPYRHRLEEKAIENLGSTLHTCLEYEEQLERMGLPKGDSVKQTDMSALLQLVQDMNNRMIAYERKGSVSSPAPRASSSSSVPFRNPNENTFHPKAIMSRSWCNFCEENHEESTCEVKKNARDKIFGKRPDTTIAVLDWVEPEDVMVINTRNKLTQPRVNMTLLVLLPHQACLLKVLIHKLSEFQKIKECLPLFPLLNTTSLTNWLISRLMLLFWTWFHP